MFQSIVNQPGVGAGRFGAGMWVSLMVHAGVFAGVLGLSGRAAEELPHPEYEIGPIRRTVQPAPRESNQPTPNSAPPPDTRPANKSPRQRVQSVKSPPTPSLGETPERKPSSSEDPTGEPGRNPDTRTLAPGLSGTLPDFINTEQWRENTVSQGEEVLPFGAGMTPPQMLSGAQLQYTREALAARVSGTVIARCTITREGDVERCRIIRGLPHMDAAVLEALTSRHYRPVSFQGQPVSVSYTFHVRLELP